MLAPSKEVCPVTQQEYLKLIDDVISKGKYKDNWESLSGHKTPAVREGGGIRLSGRYSLIHVMPFTVAKVCAALSAGERMMTALFSKASEAICVTLAGITMTAGLAIRFENAFEPMDSVPRGIT